MYEPSDAVVVDTGLPWPSTTGLPEESNNETVAPPTPLAEPEMSAEPVKDAPHWEPEGAETERFVDTASNGVVTFATSVEEPDALTVSDEPESPLNGPNPEGHTSTAVGLRHNSGASPIASTRAVADEMLPEFTVKFTSNEGETPVSVGESELKSVALPAVIGTSFQLAMAAPDESLTDNFAVNVAEGAGLVSVKDLHALTASGLVAHAIRGTTVPPGNDARVGAIDEQPTLLPTML